jgi:hypothetical protein
VLDLKVVRAFESLSQIMQRKGNFKVGMRTEKSRLRRSLTSLQELMQRVRHQTISEQAGEINIVRNNL